MTFTSLQRVKAHAVRALLFTAIACAGVTSSFAADNAGLEEKVLSGYRKDLAAYREAREAYDRKANPYWRSITEKRSARRKADRTHKPVPADYVLEQPPLYSGPPEPKDPRKPQGTREPVPVVADFLAQSKAHFGFVPEAPAREDDYRRAYARAATAAGLTPEQCVKIFGFESGGDGGYDVQAGLEYKKPGARAISTALGYNQLLATNSIELLAEAGDEILETLRSKARSSSGARRAAVEEKIAVVKKMIAFSRTVPDQWAAHTRLAGTDKGVGVHAMILDIDVGPLLQARKLLTSVEYAKRLGYDKPLTAAELEMMNLTGDGSGFDMVIMPDAMRKAVPTSNFFQQGGYERNPVAIRNNTVEKLLAATDAKMEQEAQLPGAQSLAAAFEALAQNR